jgi:uncharacterized protein YjeT (DUF2065 family)
MGDLLLGALALMLVLEGLLPFLSPGLARMFERATRMTRRADPLHRPVSMLAGAAVAAMWR